MWKTKISKWTDGLFFPLCKLQLSISQNRPVQLVPSFVEVHHIILLKKILYCKVVIFYKLNFHCPFHTQELNLEQLKHQHQTALTELQLREDAVKSLEQQLDDMKEMHGSSRDEVGFSFKNKNHYDPLCVIMFLKYAMHKYRKQIPELVYRPV